MLSSSYWVSPTGLVFPPSALTRLPSFTALIAAASASPVVVPCVQVNPNEKFATIGKDLYFKRFGVVKGDYIGMELSQKTNNLAPGEKWVYGNMVFKAEAQYQKEQLEYQISINKDGNPPPAPTIDGQFIVTYYNVDGAVIRSFFISHHDTCHFVVDYKQNSYTSELLGSKFDPTSAHSVKLSRYE